jgi:hypothetical protein
VNPQVLTVEIIDFKGCCSRFASALRQEMVSFGFLTEYIGTRKNKSHVSSIEKKSMHQKREQGRSEK